MKRIIVSMFALFLTLTLLQTGTIFAEESSNNSSPQHWTAPSSAKNTPNPVNADAKVIAAAKKIFSQQCSTCHGTSGKGDGPAAQFLGKPVANLTSEQVQSQTDGELFWKISNGNAPMPTFKAALTEEQRWRIITYLRTLKAK